MIVKLKQLKLVAVLESASQVLSTTARAAATPSRSMNLKLLKALEVVHPSSPNR